MQLTSISPQSPQELKNSFVETLEMDPIFPLRNEAFRLIQTNTLTSNKLEELFKKIITTRGNAEINVNLAKQAIEQDNVENMIIETPQDQLIWGLTMAYKVQEEEKLQEKQLEEAIKNTPEGEIPKLPLLEKPVLKSKLWKAILTNDRSVHELRASAIQLITLSQNKSCTLQWGKPKSWFWFRENINVINIDLVYSLVFGFNNSRAITIHEIGHAEESKGRPPTFEKIINELKVFETRIQKDEVLTKDEFKKFTELNIRAQLWARFYNCCEDNAVNEFTNFSSLAKNLPQDLAHANNTIEYILRYKQSERIQATDKTKEKELKQNPALKIIDEIGNTIICTHFAEHGLIQREEEWADFGVPNLKLAKELQPKVGKDEGIANKISLHHMSQAEHLNEKARIATSNTLRKNRYDIMDELWTKYIEPHAKKLAEEQSQNAKLQKGPPKPGQKSIKVQGDPNEKEEGQGQGEGQGKGQGQGEGQEKGQGQGEGQGKGQGQGEGQGKGQGQGEGQGKGQGQGEGQGKGQGQGGQAAGGKPDQQGKKSEWGNKPGELHVPQTGQTIIDPNQPGRPTGRPEDGEYKPTDEYGNDLNPNKNPGEKIKPTRGDALDLAEQQKLEDLRREMIQKSQENERDASNKKYADNLARNAATANDWLDKLPIGDLRQYDKCVVAWQPAIKRVHKMLKKIQEEQLQSIIAVSPNREIIPEDGDITKHDTSSYIAFRRKQKGGERIEDKDLEHWKVDIEKPKPVPIDLFIEVDGSGSMGGERIQRAMQAAIILREAAKIKEKSATPLEINTYIGIWGPNQPPMIATPDTPDDIISKTIQGLLDQNGLGSGTELNPAIQRAFAILSNEKQKKGVHNLSGCTHFMYFSDGDIADSKNAAESIATAIEVTPRATFDVALVVEHHGETEIETLKKIDTRRKKWQEVGILRESNKDKIVSSMVLGLLERVKKSKSMITPVPTAYKQKEALKIYKKVTGNSIKKNK
jgi:Mg-chelatase subunit ChlD